MTKDDVNGLLSQLGYELTEEDQKQYDNINIATDELDKDKKFKEKIKKFDDTEWAVLAKKNNFLRKVTDLIKSDSDMAYKLAVSAGIFLISFVTRKSQYIDLAQARIRFNIYMLVMGFSGRSRKTTTFSMIEKIINAIDDKMLLPDKMTPQAMFKELLKQPDAVFMRDELSGFFQDLEQKYMKGTLEFLSKLYDVKDVIKESTISRGNQPLENAFFRFYGGTTPTVVKYMKDEQFEQGFLARFHFIYDDDKVRKRKPLGFEPSKFEKNMQGIVDDLEKMRACPVNVFLARDKPQLYADYEDYCYMEADKYLDQDDYILAAFYERLPIHSLKLAGLFTLADISELGYTQNEIILSEEHIELSCKFGRLFEQEYLNLVYRYRSEAPSAPFKTEERRLNKVLNIVKQNGGWMARSTLHRKTKMVQRIFDETLITLSSMEQSGTVRITKEKLIKLNLVHPSDKLPLRGQIPDIIFLKDEYTSMTALLEYCISVKIIDPKNWDRRYLLELFVNKYKENLQGSSQFDDLKEIISQMKDYERSAPKS